MDDERRTMGDRRWMAVGGQWTVGEGTVQFANEVVLFNFADEQSSYTS
jgi:hypothetical protein